jgi:hypothetical protein
MANSQKASLRVSRFVSLYDGETSEKVPQRDTPSQVPSWSNFTCAYFATEQTFRGLNGCGVVSNILCNARDTFCSSIAWRRINSK